MRALGPLFLLLVFACDEVREAPAQPPAKKAKGGPRPALVEVAEVRTGEIEDAWRFLGDVQALSRASLAAGAQGAVQRVEVREGDRIERGQLLVEVDPALARARLAVARANQRRAEEALAQAKRERKRLEGLENRVVAEVELERARSQVLELQAELTSRQSAVEEAKAQLALHRVRAPFDGVVAARSVDRGDWVRPGDPVLGVVSTGGLEVLVDASKDLLGYVKKGDTAKLVGPTTVEATVAGVVPALDPKNRTLRVRLRPEAAGQWLLPGAEVNVEFSVDLSGTGVIVPQDALLIAPTETKLVKVDGGAAKLVLVEVIAKAGADALVRGEGLEAGDRVVTRGNERVRPGQPLEIKD